MNTKEEIFDYIERRYGYNKEELKTRNSHRKICNVRQVAMFLLRERLKISFPQIGRIFGKDHSTAFHAHAKVAGLLKDKRIDFEGLDISTISMKHKSKTVDKSLTEAYKIHKEKFLRAFEIDPFFMMMETNKIAEKVLNRKD